FGARRRRQGAGTPFAGGVVGGSVYSVTGPSPSSVTYTGPTGVCTPFDVTTNRTPERPEWSVLEYRNGVSPRPFNPPCSPASIRPPRVLYLPAALLDWPHVCA